MPLIELLGPQQRDWLCKLRRRLANREFMRRLRADLAASSCVLGSTCPSKPAPRRFKTLRQGHRHRPARTRTPPLQERAEYSDFKG